MHDSDGRGPVQWRLRHLADSLQRAGMDVAAGELDDIRVQLARVVGDLERAGMVDAAMVLADRADEGGSCEGVGGRVRSTTGDETMGYQTELQVFATLDVQNLDGEGRGAVDLALAAETTDEEGELVEDAVVYEGEAVWSTFDRDRVRDARSPLSTIREVLEEAGWAVVGQLQEAGDFGWSVAVEPLSDEARAWEQEATLHVM